MIEHVSASQITLFRSCPRKWAYSYLLKMKQEATPALTFGKGLHAIAEHYLLTGTEVEPELGPPTPNPDILALTDAQMHRACALVSSAIANDVLPQAHYLPAPGCSVELAILGILTIAGVPVKGFIDYLDESDPELPLVGDHKTTSSWRWAKDGPELAHNVQMMLYAAVALDRNPEAAEVTLRHNQFLSRGAIDTRWVSTTVTREHVAEALSSIEETVREMLALTATFLRTGTIAHASQVAAACSDFGGCYLKTPCYSLPTTRPTMTKKHDPIADLLARRSQAKPEAAPGPFAAARTINRPGASQAPPMPQLEPTVDDQLTPEVDGIRRNVKSYRTGGCKITVGDLTAGPVDPVILSDPTDEPPAPAVPPVKKSQGLRLSNFRVSRRITDGNYGSVEASGDILVDVGPVTDRDVKAGIAHIEAILIDYLAQGG